MKLLIEVLDNFSDYEIIKEESENKDRKFKIKGPFLVAEQQNKNKRTYSKALIEREITNFTTNKIKQKNAFGELDHPPTPTVSAKNAAIHVDELVMDGNIAIGTATVLDTPNGRIIKSILNDGYKLGVSSRGVGTLNNGLVNLDYKFLAEDVVTDPSGYGCYVESILENKEYIIGPNGDIVEAAVNQLQEQVDKDFSSKVVLGYIYQFLNKIRNS